MAEYFYQVAYTLWQSVGEFLLPVVCVSWGMWMQIVMSNQLLCVKFFHPPCHIVCICWSLPLPSSASDSFWF